MSKSRDFSNFDSLPPHVRWSMPRVCYSEFSPFPHPGLDFTGDPGMTDPSQAAELDVNWIVDRFTKTGILPGVDIPRVYGDLSDVPSYMDALEIITRASEQFDSLNAVVRKRFDNDPVLFLEFMERDDEEATKERLSLGLATLRPPTDTDRIVSELLESRKDSKKPSPTPRQPSPPADSDEA